MKAQDFDRKFDAEEDLTDYLDFSQAKRPHQPKQTIQMQLPIWLIDKLHQESERQGIPTDVFLENFLIKHLA